MSHCYDLFSIELLFTITETLRGPTLRFPHCHGLHFTPSPNISGLLSVLDQNPALVPAEAVLLDGSVLAETERRRNLEREGESASSISTAHAMSRELCVLYPGVAQTKDTVAGFDAPNEKSAPALGKCKHSVIVRR